MSRQSDRDNHSNQLNPNNDAYWQSRGWDERPGDWVERVPEERTQPDESQKRSSAKENR